MWSTTHPSITVSRETIERLTLYHDLLLKWRERINLVSNDTVADAWNRHFLDSIQIKSLIPETANTIADLGSGAGFPGMVLAIAGVTGIHLIESDTRKIIFLKEVARITSAPVHIHHCRIEDNPTGKVDVITSRACSDLDTLFTLSTPYVSRETICLFHKGKNYAKELHQAETRWQFHHEIFPSATDSQSAIIKASQLAEKT